MPNHFWRCASDYASRRTLCQDNRTCGGTSVSALSESDGEPPPLAVSTEENRRTVGQDEMSARVPSALSPGTQPSPKRRGPNGLAAKLEAASDLAPSSHLGVRPPCSGCRQSAEEHWTREIPPIISICAAEGASSVSVNVAPRKRLFVSKLLMYLVSFALSAP